MASFKEYPSGHVGKLPVTWVRRWLVSGTPVSSAKRLVTNWPQYADVRSRSAGGLGITLSPLNAKWNNPNLLYMKGFHNELDQATFLVHLINSNRKRTSWYPFSISNLKSITAIGWTDLSYSQCSTNH